jgi:thiamine biosynthesis protein ThiS
MKLRIKLYAMLGVYLPDNAHKNEADLVVDDSTTITDVLASLKVPEEECHLVLVNGVFIAPSERPDHQLTEGDALAVWPPVAGG